MSMLIDADFGRCRILSMSILIGVDFGPCRFRSMLILMRVDLVSQVRCHAENVRFNTVYMYYTTYCKLVSVVLRRTEKICTPKCLETLCTEILVHRKFVGLQ